MFLLLFFVGVTADGDDADRRAGSVRDDDCLLLTVTTGRSHRAFPPSAGNGGAAGSGALRYGAARGGVLLHPLGTLGGAV